MTLCELSLYATPHPTRPCPLYHRHDRDCTETPEHCALRNNLLILNGINGQQVSQVKSTQGSEHYSNLSVPADISIPDKDYADIPQTKPIIRGL